MENRINIAELLKNCPKGMELDCTIYDNVEFEGISDNKDWPIAISVEGYPEVLNPYGCISYRDYTKCVIYPKGKTTWEGFVPPCKFKDGDIIADNHKNIAIYKGKMWYNCNLADFYCGYRNYDNRFLEKPKKDGHFGSIEELHLATEEEKQKLFDVIKENGYMWNAETKTLEKLIEPKFKVGDRVRLKSNPDYIYTIYCLTWDDNKKLAYKLLPKNDKHLILVSLNKQDNYELVPNKFDITTLKPFDKVLVRQNNNGIWGIDLFGFYNEGYYHTTGNCIYVQCVPYEQNEHLLGKTDDCDEYYKTWE